jgi:methionine synthase II (cobalamin-independent)
VFRAEVIGSMLRPSYPQEGRAGFEQGLLCAADFKRLEDRAVDQVIAMQEGAGVEIPDELRGRIDEAARFFAHDQLGLSTQCGSASIAAGNPITEADEERKLRLVADTAHAIWG